MNMNMNMNMNWHNGLSRAHLRFLAVLLIAAIAGCASPPGVIALSPDTYLLAKEDHGGVFGSMVVLKAEVIREANAFAEKQGKVAIPISAKENPITRPMMWASFEYQFRVVDKTDPEARRTSLLPRADIVVEKKEAAATDRPAQSRPTVSSDVYTELIKIDDLRKRGIITDSEFDALKKALLSAK